MSRLTTLQPANHLPIIARLAEQDGATEQAYQERLRPHKPEYDPALQWRVLELYVEHLCGAAGAGGRGGLGPGAAAGVHAAGRWAATATAARTSPRPAERAEPCWLERTAPIARQYGMLIASCYYRAEATVCTTTAC